MTFESKNFISFYQRSEMSKKDHLAELSAIQKRIKIILWTNKAQSHV